MAVIFECTSDIAMFRKPYTTTSSVSFAFPPPTAVAGLISAMLGIENGRGYGAASAAYWNELSGTQAAISVKSPIKWLRAAINFWNVKNPTKAPHIQVKHQFLYKPKFRIYVRGVLEEPLKKKLEKEEFVFTPFMGTAYALADVKYLGTFTELPVRCEEIEVASVVPLSSGMVFDFKKCKKIYKEIVPFQFTEDRALKNTITIFYTDASGKLTLKNRGNSDVSICNGETIAWLPSW